MRAFAALLVFAAACSPSVDAPCAVEADCSSGFRCVDGACTESAEADAGMTCVSSLDCADGNRCRDGVCVPLTVDAGNPADAGPDPNGCGNGPACSDRTIGGQPIERCIDGECRQSCLSDQMCRDPGAPICTEVQGGRSCMPAQCQQHGDCGPQQACRGGRCLDVTFCEGDGDCAEIEICNGDGHCQERDRCMVDADCGGEAACIEGHCFDTPSCENGSCPEGLDCVAGQCMPGICRSADDCAEGELCSAGDCIAAPNVEPHRIVIVTPYGVCAGGSEGACRLPLAPGATAQLSAMALDVNGHGMAGVAVTWSTDAPGQAGIDAAGLVTAVAAGRARIDAVAGQLSADRTVTVEVVPPPAQDQVIVIDALGRTVEGARVTFRNGGDWRHADGTTNADGVQRLAGLRPGAVDLSIDAEGFEQTMIVNALSKGEGNFQAIVPIMRDRSNRASGFRARIDFANVHSQGDGELSVSGASVPDLLDFDLTAFAGDNFVSQLSIPGQGTQDVPLPGGITFSATVFGFPINLKDTAYARGAAGLRTAWSFAGRVDPMALFGRFQGVRSPADAVMAIFPLMSAFDHGLVAGLPLVERDLIVDVDDINGNGDRGERVPDWQAFALTELRPGTVQNGRTEMAVPAANGADGSIVTGGIFHPGTGYTPLGLTAHTGAEPTDMLFSVAPSYGGLEGEDYVFAVIALSDGGAATRARIRRSARLDTRQAFDAHLPLPQASLDGGELESTRLSGDLVRVRGSAGGRALRIYAGPGEGRLDLRPAPRRGEGNLRMEAGLIEVIELDALPPGPALPYLVSGQGLSLSAIGQHASAFARVPFGN